MDTIEAIRSRRSIRSYKPVPVPRDLIEQVILDAAQAPPPFSGEVPWTFHVIEGVERIATCGTRAKQFAKDHRRGEASRSWLDRDDFKVFWEAPVVIIISGRVEDCCRAGQNLMLSAHARGLGTCWVGSPMEWLRSEETKAALKIAPDMTPVSALCLGYAAEVPVAPVKARPAIIWSN